MAHIREFGDVAEESESLSLGTSLNTAELLISDESVSPNKGEKHSHNFNPSIVPNSARSLNERINVIEISEETEENDNTTQQNNRQNANDSNDDVICLDDNEHIISGRQDGGGFVVNGSVALDEDTINSDMDMRNVESDDEDINYTPSQQLPDDSIVFVDCVRDQALIPRVFRGYIKEFIEDRPNRLGILYSQECGLVLFHAKHIWINGTKTSGYQEDVEDLSPGRDVSFYHYQIEDDGYRNIISPDGTLRQAAAVWIGTRPAHLLKETETDLHREQMREYRELFISLLKEKQFLPMALVRGRGKVEGYISSKVGIIKTDDGRDSDNCRVLFHMTDIYCFGKPLANGRQSAQDAVPVGLKLCFDARAIRGDNENNSISYQACAVFAGSWPAVPHPTVLPGGPGSFAPCYESQGEDNGTYHYLQLSLKPNLDRKWEDFCDSTHSRHNRDRNDQKFRFIQNKVSIETHEDYKQWRHYFAPDYVLLRDRRRMDSSRQLQGTKRKKENYHYFKPSIERKWKILKKEESDEDDLMKAERHSISKRIVMKAETIT